MKTVKAFIASPSDLNPERRAFRDVIEALNSGFGEGADVRFVPLGWEDLLASTGRRPQSVINEEIDSCDVFVLVLHRRWGQEAADSPYSSYTEEEFHRALDRYNKTKSPEIFVFFKNVDAASRADPGPQLSRVLEFRKTLEESCVVFYRTFEKPRDFADDLGKHLKAFAKGNLPAHPATHSIVLPIEYRQAIQQADQALQQKITEWEAAKAAASLHEAWSKSLELRLVTEAMNAADDGRLETASSYFAELTSGTNQFEVLHAGWAFYYRIGDLRQASSLAQRMAAIDGMESATERTTIALHCFALTILDTGDIENAKACLAKAVSYASAQSRKDLLADQYSAQGLVALATKRFDIAEEKLKLALETDSSSPARQGRDYGYLAQVYQERGRDGDNEKAEDMHKRGLEIHERLSKQQEIARHYCNMGIILQNRGELEEAEKMHRAALEIDERLGWKKGMASHYGNLAIIMHKRGKEETADAYMKKSRKLLEDLGNDQLAQRLHYSSDRVPITGG